MSENITLKLREYFPPKILKLLIDAGNRSWAHGQELFLVGGSVRDPFLNRVNLDLDVVVEGDAIKLAQELAKEYQAKIVTHDRFGTAKLNFIDFSLDLATARREIYEKPGALPMVQGGTIIEDLQRRDFSINAMAVYLTPHSFGKLIDPYHGLTDINRRFIRILHPLSFIFDATRMFRAIRYEQRLLFMLEPNTAKQLQQDAHMLDTISSTRVRHELELILREDYPERMIKRAEKLGILTKLHPSLTGNGWISDKFDQARQLYVKGSLFQIYFCLLVYNLSEKDNDQFISRLNLSNKLTQMMRQTLLLKSQIHNLEKNKISYSKIYEFLSSYVLTAIQVNMLSIESTTIKQYLHLYLSKLRYIKPCLTGDDLIELGIPAGPELGNALNVIHKAKLDGEIRTKQDEVAFVHNYVLGSQKP
jgi:tRNA nucleotidyltransferase (CCA-adding enzyme)